MEEYKLSETILRELDELDALWYEDSVFDMIDIYSSPVDDIINSNGEEL